MSASNIALDENYTKKLEMLCGKYIPKVSKVRELIDKETTGFTK